MPKKTKRPEVEREPMPPGEGFPMPPGGALVFQHPAAKDFAAWQGPTVKELVEAKAQDVLQSEAEKYKAITIRPTVQHLALLDELAKVFRQSRNECACALLGAALREALGTLPDTIRERVQMQAFKQLEWGVVTPNGQVVLPDSMFEDGKLMRRKVTPAAPAKTTDEPERKPDA